MLTVHEGPKGLIIINFSDEQRKRLGEAYAALPIIADGTTLRRLSLQILGSVLTSRDQALLHDHATGETGSGVFMYNNLPNKRVEWGPLPGQAAIDAKHDWTSEALLYGLGAMGGGGEAYCPAGETSGIPGQKVPIADLVATDADRLKHTGNGSQASLGFHAENCAFKFGSPGFDLAPKALLLTGVSEQPIDGPVTPVVVAARALRRVRPQYVERLRRPAVRHLLPVRQRRPGEEQLIGPVPVIFGAEGREEIWASFYGDMIVPIDASAAGALSAVRDALDEEAISLAVLPGTLVAITQNGRVLHGRSAFNPVIDEAGRSKRWIQRLFLTGRLDAFLHFPSSGDRVFDLSLAD